MIRVSIIALLALLVGTVLGAALPDSAAAGQVAINRAAGGVYNVQVRSLKEARFARVVKQQYDFSCGSAALATLLTFHYEKPVSETDVFTEMFEVGDQERIRRLGFSLLDMKKYLKTHELRADGFKLSIEKLANLGVPSIALIETSGYKHFVVVKGMAGDKLLLGDPARGSRAMPIEEFEQSWNGIVFVIRDKASVGRENFNSKDDWAVLASAPFGTAMSRQSLSSFSIHLKNTMANSF